MKNRIMALVLAGCIIAAGLVGCGKKEAEAPAKQADNTEEAAQESIEGGKGTEISGSLEVAVFSNGDLMDQFWDKVVAEFSSLYPDCEVTLIANPKIEESMRPRFVSDNPPDVYYMGGNANMDEQALTGDGKFMKLNDFYETAEALGYGGLLKDHMGAEIFNEQNGDIYGMSFAYSVWGYYYNVGMAEEYGWEPPVNWDDFCELAPKIKEQGIYPIIHQGKYPDYMGYGLMQAGIAVDNGKETLVSMGNLDADTYRSEEVLKAWQKYETIRENDWAPPSALSLTHTEAQMEWLQNKAFLIPCGNWLEGEMANDIPEGFQMAFRPSFWFDSDNTPVYVGASCRISIAENTKNPEAAKAFLQVIFSKNITKAVAEYGMGIPCMNDELEGVELPPSNASVLQQVAKGEVKIINEVGGSGNFEPYAEQRTIINNNIAAVLGGQKTAEQALEDVAKEVERIAGDESIVKVTIR